MSETRPRWERDTASLGARHGGGGASLRARHGLAGSETRYWRRKSMGPEGAWSLRAHGAKGAWGGAVAKRWQSLAISEIWQWASKRRGAQGTDNSGG